MARILYIVNPSALGGRALETWERFRALWPGGVDERDVLMAEGAEHARQAARSAEGYDVLAAVGGDGMAGEILSGIMESAEQRPKMAVIPAGTGNDIARSVGIFNVEDAVAALRAGRSRAVDLIRVDCTVNERPAQRYSFLSCNIGFPIASPHLLKPWMKRILTPKGAYFLAALRGLAFFHPPRATVRWKGQEYSGRVWMVSVANAEWVGGGGMRVAPGASIDDGLLNVTIVRGQSRLRTLLKLPKIATGAHVREPEVLYFPATEIEIACDPPTGVEIDGDAFGATPASFAVCPRAVEMLRP